MTELAERFSLSQGYCSKLIKPPAARRWAACRRGLPIATRTSLAQMRGNQPEAAAPEAPARTSLAERKAHAEQKAGEADARMEQGHQTEQNQGMER